MLRLGHRIMAGYAFVVRRYVFELPHSYETLDFTGHD